MMLALKNLALMGCLATRLVTALPHLEQRNPLPDGCRYMTNSDFMTLSDGEMQLILQYFNGLLNGEKVCTSNAQDLSVAWEW